jgi:crotonobetainyl-CoA:carnitine CoA-transferase CaiB-like acyl-CoA transferase
VRDLYEATQEPHLRARNTIVRDESGALNLNNPIRFLHEPAEPDWRLPQLGEHNSELLD